jgi:hypothetical protein
MFGGTMCGSHASRPRYRLVSLDGAGSSAPEQVDLPPPRSGSVVSTAASPKSEGLSWPGWNLPQDQSPPAIEVRPQTGTDPSQNPPKRFQT